MENSSGTLEGDKYIHQPHCFSEEDYTNIMKLISDNFPDLTENDKTQILDFIDAHFYWNK